jgi:methylenetetrahydrofolate dehydrogenase (NADP+) / methenyltetrahydrofolate cyclohydrolase
MIIDGKKIAEQWLQEIKKNLPSQPLHLAAILVGGDLGLEKFVKLKKKAAESIGVTFSVYKFEDDAQEVEILEVIEYLNNDLGVNGILVELPLPKNLDAQKILNSISKEKDVDLLSQIAEDEYYSKKVADLMPPAVGALVRLIQYCQIFLADKKVAVFGAGRLVGQPIIHWLKDKCVNVSVIDENTQNPEKYSLQADVIISGVGKPDLVTGEMVKDEVTIIDYGYGKKGEVMAGDVDEVSVFPKSLWFTPVPGGMGPLVVAAVFENLLKLFEKQKRS